MINRDPITTRTWWCATVIRATRTFAGALAANLGVGVGLFDMPWMVALSLSGGATLAGFLLSIAAPPPEAGIVVPQGIEVRSVTVDGIEHQHIYLDGPEVRGSTVTDPHPSGLAGPDDWRRAGGTPE